MKTVFITGSSTGIGRATALHFHQQGWNVAASMRRPEQETSLQTLPNVFCPKLDVTDSVSIQNAVAETIKRFGKIDAVVNNAGYGLIGPFEGATEEQIKRQFATNLFGVMAMTKAVLPHFRSQRSGFIVNVSSMGGRIVFPLYSLYLSSKFALEGFSESLMYELAPLGIKVKIIEPASTHTEFGERSKDTTMEQTPADYKSLVETGFARMHALSAKNSASAVKVARTIYTSVTDGSAKLRYPVGPGSRLLGILRRVLPDFLFIAIVRFFAFGKN